MTTICAAISPQMVRDADTVFAKLGMSFRAQDVIDQIDFDPDEAYGAIDQLVSAAEAIRAGTPEDCAALFAGWVGEGGRAACEYVECQRSFWDEVLDFLLWVAENLVQLLDYIVDLIRWLAVWLSWLVVWVGAIILAIDLVLALGSGGIGAVVTVFEAPVFTFLGAVGGVSFLISILSYALNLLFEWLETLIREQRAKFCGKGLPSLPDWDPGGYPPPVPTGDGE